METELALKDIIADTLTDLKGIKVDSKLPISERKKAFIAQTKSAYLYRVNGKAVKVVFNPYGPSLQDGMVSALKCIARERI